MDKSIRRNNVKYYINIIIDVFFFGFVALLAISQFTILLLNYEFYVGIRFLAGCLESNSNPGPQTGTLTARLTRYPIIEGVKFG